MVICCRFKVTRPIREAAVQKTKETIRCLHAVRAVIAGAFCCLAAHSVSANAATVGLAWERNSDPRVAGYRVYYGSQPRTYTNSVNAGNGTNTVVGGLTVGAPYFFAVAAYTQTGVESPPSNEINYIPTNRVPVISAVAAQTVSMNQATPAIPFVVGDSETPAANLLLSGVAANPGLVAAISFGGSGSNRTVKVIPVTGKSGSTTITLSVSDGALTATTTFGFTVVGGGDGLPASTSITSFTASPSGKLITWGSSSGSVYRVVYKSNLSQTNWTDLSSDIMTTGTQTSWLDTNFAVPSRFYRVRSVR
jgi:hypothetical protein